DEPSIEPSAAHGSRHVLRFTAYPSRLLPHIARLASLGWLANSNAYLLLLVVAYMAYIAAVGGDWLPEGRFVVPLIPLLVLLAQAGLSRLAGHGRWGLALATALLAL